MRSRIAAPNFKKANNTIKIQTLEIESLTVENELQAVSLKHSSKEGNRSGDRSEEVEGGTVNIEAFKVV